MVIAASAISLLAILLVPILLVRFLKRPVAAFHRAITNRIARPFASRLPGFGVVTNAGRNSGKLYRTPVNVFRDADGFLIALTYGRESGWVKNVVAAGGCQLETCRVQYQLCAPTIVHDPTRHRFPFLVRVILRLINANDFMQLSNSQEAHSRLRKLGSNYEHRPSEPPAPLRFMLPEVGSSGQP
jgi:deazaflavin-dependent oxidoreductase (nitroreductase family)